MGLVEALLVARALPVVDRGVAAAMVRVVCERRAAQGALLDLLGDGDLVDVGRIMIAIGGTGSGSAGAAVRCCMRDGSHSARRDSSQQTMKIHDRGHDQRLGC